MYPETDEPFLLVDEGLLQDVLSSLPELREDKAKRFMELGLGAELATQLSKAPEASLFQELSLEFKGLEATTIVQTLLASPKEAARRYEADTSVLNPGHFRQILALLADGRISKSAVAELMAKICACPSKDVLDIASSGGLMNLSDGELRGLVEHAISENKLLNAGQLMGKIMAQTKGKADAKKVQEMIALAKK
jgi:Glu-tRNA(Gln) amidotransferase subunit E-like FAD-binding protein